jgi:O-antigen ligase
MATGPFAFRDTLPAVLLAAGFTVLAAMLGLLAVVSPIAALGVTLGLAFLAVTVVDLTAGLCLFTVLTFFEHLPGMDTGLSPVKVAGAVLVLCWLLVVTTRERGSAFMVQDRPLLAYAAGALVAWALASRLWAPDAAAAGSNAFRLALGVILVFVVFTAVREPRHLRWVLWSFIAGALFSAAVGLATTSPEAGMAAPEEGRLAGGIADPNELAAILVPALALAAFALAAVTNAIARWALAISVVVFAICLFLTESRGGLVALVVILVASVAFAGRWRPQVVALALVVAGLGVAYYTLFAPPESLQRLTHFLAGGGTGRTDLWAVAGEMIRDHPILGVGVGNFQVVEPTYAYGTINLENVKFIVDTPKVAHNTYLEVFAELGIVGIVAFVGIVGGALWKAPDAIRTFMRSGDFSNEALARGLLVGLAGMLAAYLFVSGQYEKQLWLLVGLTAALPSVARAGSGTSREP